MIKELENLAARKGVIVGASTISMAIGFIVGYFVAKNLLEKKFTEIATKEIDEAREYFQHRVDHEVSERIDDETERLVPGEAVEALRIYSGGNKPDLSELVFERAKPYGDNVIEDTIEDEEIMQTLFDKIHQTTDEEREAENRNRTEEAPYILDKDEFLGNESDYTQATLTYFEGDGVLTDERDDLIEDIGATVGSYNLRFGHRSDDPNVVYVRNDVLGIEFEILRSSESFAEVVAGFKVT